MNTETNSTLGGGIALQAVNNRLATVNDAKAATGTTSTLPGNKCITVDEMNAMIGNIRELPSAVLQGFMSDGVYLIVRDTFTSGKPIGNITLTVDRSSTSYNLQNLNKSAFLYVEDSNGIDDFSISCEENPDVLYVLDYVGFHRYNDNMKREIQPFSKGLVEVAVNLNLTTIIAIVERQPV